MFKKVELTQGTPDWLLWRSGTDGTSITATAAAIIMGVYPYGNVYDLWADKVGIQKFVFTENDAATHGTNTEEKARQEFIKATGIEMTPACVENLKYPFIRASLDGLNEEHKIGLEIKCPYHFGSFSKHKKGIENSKTDDEFDSGLLKYYYAQVQHQMLVTSFDRWIYWSFYRGADALSIIKKDEKFQKELLRRCLMFRELVLTKVPPREEDFLPYA